MTTANEAANPSVTFETEVISVGNNTGIVVPADVIDRLGAGKRPAVDVDINGYCYRTTVGVMNGQHMISVSAAVRKASGLSGGDPVVVALTLNETPREVDVPDDFAAALRSNPPAEAFFATLPNSLQRYHIDQVATAKQADTRQRRIDKAVSMFLAGKKR